MNSLRSSKRLSVYSTKMVMVGSTFSIRKSKDSFSLSEETPTSHQPMAINYPLFIVLIYDVQDITLIVVFHDRYNRCR